ncbi:MAG: hypothetical protein ACI9SY_000015 [Candidatus Paceibacteria bacterium]|jgi:hypothetical protein
MRELPSYIKGVIEGGKPSQEFSKEELQELEDALMSLSPETRAEVEAMLSPEASHPFEFTSEKPNDNK